jgi:sirohydrochlorin cobaltochelatase
MKTALVLFAHGARDAQWSEPFRAIRQAVAARRPDLTVELAFLELMQPTLGDCVAQLTRDGHTRITVAPLFLAQGGHLKKDLPRLLKDLSARHGGDLSAAADRRTAERHLGGSRARRARQQVVSDER